MARPTVFGSAMPTDVKRRSQESRHALPSGSKARASSMLRRSDGAPGALAALPMPSTVISVKNGKSM